ncbi:hypothetical protein BDV93DRAFT_606586 [Ceratobasidium sp. AG-I]|nr:hypothetical protein BDV93DRAFT_606586 [Ceratobasidium sp. AG-I]
MSDLTTVEGTLAYLSSTKYEAIDVQLLPGGHSAFTYRATLKSLLPTGETSVIVKHCEGYPALHKDFPYEAERGLYEYECLVALAASGLYDDNSVVQVPKPLDYDPETYTIFMTDINPADSLTKALTAGVEGAHTGENASSKLEEACSLASAVGSAVGDFMGRFHNWSALPEQSGLRERVSENVAAKKCALSQFDLTIRSATKFGLKEPWVDAIVQDEIQAVSKGGDVIVMGDLWFENILISRAPEHGKLRLYIIDWEVVRPAHAELEIGQVTGVGVSFARRYGVQDVYPFLPALHRAYSQHRTLDPVRTATAAGLDTLGFGMFVPWTRKQGEEFSKGLVMAGFELLELAHKKDEEAIRTKSLLKHLYGSGSE